MKYNWNEMNDTQKIKAIDHELELVTHNGTTKDDLLNMLRWMRGQFEVVEKTCKNCLFSSRDYGETFKYISCKKKKISVEKTETCGEWQVKEDYELKNHIENAFRSGMNFGYAVDHENKSEDENKFWEEFWNTYGKYK